MIFIKYLLLKVHIQNRILETNKTNKKYSKKGQDQMAGVIRIPIL